MRSYKTTVYACYLGSITQAALINLTPVLFAVLLREYGLSYGALGFLVLTNFVTQVGRMWPSARRWTATDFGPLCWRRER